MGSTSYGDSALSPQCPVKTGRVPFDHGSAVQSRVGHRRSPRYCARRLAFCASARSSGADQPKRVIAETVDRFPMMPVGRFSTLLGARRQGRSVAASRVTGGAIVARQGCAPWRHNSLGASTRPIALQVGLLRTAAAARDALMLLYTLPDFPSQHRPVDCTGSVDRLSARRP
jgi:hypothetical protein